MGADAEVEAFFAGDFDEVSGGFVKELLLVVCSGFGGGMFSPRGAEGGKFGTE